MIPFLEITKESMLFASKVFLLLMVLLFSKPGVQTKTVDFVLVCVGEKSSADKPYFSEDIIIKKASLNFIK